MENYNVLSDKDYIIGFISLNCGIYSLVFFVLALLLGFVGVTLIELNIAVLILAVFAVILGIVAWAKGDRYGMYSTIIGGFILLLITITVYVYVSGMLSS